MKNLKKMSYGPINFYLKPEYVYIPLYILESSDVTLLVKKGDYVYKGSIIARKRDENKLSIFSSVSGTVEDIIKEKNSQNKEINVVKIKNDFKESYETKRNENKNINIPKNELLEILKKYSLYENNKIIYKLLNTSYRNIIIDANEPDPYITSREALLSKHADEILETLDYLLKITSSEECTIIVDKKSIKSLEALNNYIGTYDRIKINNICKESKSLTLNIETIYSIYEAIRYDIPNLQRIITISGEGIKNPQNIVVKNGTKANEVIDFIGSYKRFNTKKMFLIAGDTLKGKAMKNDDFVIDTSVQGILVIKAEEDLNEKPCIKCGKCINICPQKLNPLLLTHLKNINNLKKLNIDKCTECGLCSYICPSKRNIKEKIIKVKEYQNERV